MWQRDGNMSIKRELMCGLQILCHILSRWMRRLYLGFLSTDLVVNQTRLAGQVVVQPCSVLVVFHYINIKDLLRNIFANYRQTKCTYKFSSYITMMTALPPKPNFVSSKPKLPMIMNHCHFVFKITFSETMYSLSKPYCFI